VSANVSDASHPIVNAAGALQVRASALQSLLAVQFFMCLDAAATFSVAVAAAFVGTRA
jgi:hypothetical protein